MNETNPSSMLGRNESPPTGPSENLIPSSARERIEQLLAVVAELEAANDSLQRQLTSALAAEHTPVLHYGKGTWQRSINARSIKVLFMVEQMEKDSEFSKGTGKWSIMADETSLTPHCLPEPEALAEYTKARAAWMAALEPPQAKK